MKGFLRHSALLFLALRAGDAVTLAAGMWFVPKYVSTAEIGAVLPLTSFATLLSLPVFAFAMTVMKESAALAACGAQGQVKSLLRGVFWTVACLLAAVLLGAAWLVPWFARRMAVSDASTGFVAVAAAFLGCAAPVYTDALQSLRRFRALAAVEAAGSAVRFAVMAVTMPLRALAGYFAGQAALPAFRIAASVFALRDVFAAKAERFWNRGTVRRIAFSFAAVLAYQAAPMFAALVEQSVLRTSLCPADSAGYYMATRFSDILHYLTFPLLLVMFPYTAAAAGRGEDTSPYVVKCSLAALAAAAVLAGTYALCGERLLALMPHGADHAAFAPRMPLLVAITAMTSCQVFYTNAEVSAGRFRFLWWLVPMHLVYPAALKLAAVGGALSDPDDLLAWFAAASAARLAFSAAEMLVRAAKRRRASGR